MNRYLFVCHVREDERPQARSLAKALADLGMKVVYHSVSPWRPGEHPHGVLREQVETGLNECCYGVVLLTRAFLARDWPSDELGDIVSRVARGEERLIHVHQGIEVAHLASLHPPLAVRPAIVLGEDYAEAARAIVGRLARDRSSPRAAAASAGVNGRALRLFACRDCGSREELQVECLTAPPLGASGMLVCPSCGRGYPIRGRVTYLLGEGACVPDEPTPPDLEPPVEPGSLSG